MRLKAVDGIRDGGDSALRIIGIGLDGFLLGYDGDGSKGGELDGQRQTRNAAADNEKVRLDIHMGFRSGIKIRSPYQSFPPKSTLF